MPHGISAATDGAFGGVIAAMPCSRRWRANSRRNVTGLTWDQINLARKVAWIHPDQAKAQEGHRGAAQRHRGKESCGCSASPGPRLPPSRSFRRLPSRKRPACSSRSSGRRLEGKRHRRPADPRGYGLCGACASAQEAGWRRSPKLHGRGRRHPGYGRESLGEEKSTATWALFACRKTCAKPRLKVQGGAGFCASWL